MEQFNSTSLNSNAMRLIRRPLSALKARQYQLVYVDGILDSEDEYQVTFYNNQNLCIYVSRHYRKTCSSQNVGKAETCPIWTNCIVPSK